MASLDEINKTLEENRVKVYKKDYTFFNIGYVSTLAKASISQGCDCPECQANVERLKALAAGYPELLKRGESGRRMVEDCMDDITSHLIKNHGYARAGWYRPLYSLIGLGAGLIIGLLCIFVFFNGSGFERVSFWISLSLPAIAGYVAGGVKDFKYEKAGKKL